MIKKYLPWIIAIVLAVLLLVSVRSCQQVKQDNERFKSNLDISRDSVHHLIGNNGELINRVGSMQLTVNDLKTQADQLGIDKKALQDQVGNLKNLVASTKATAVVQDVIHTKVYDTTYVMFDKTLYGKKLNWHNKFLTINELIASNDSVTLKYKYSFDFNSTTYWKHRGFLGINKDLITDFTLSDPNAVVTKAQSLTIVAPSQSFLAKWWDKLLALGLGFYLGSKH